MTDPAQLRRELEALALGGSGFEAIVARLAAVSGRTVRLVAVHGGLLASSELDAVRAAASVPASGVPASASLDRGVEPGTVQRALARDDPVDIVCTDGMAVCAVPLRAGTRRVGLLVMEAPVGGQELAALRAAVVPVAIEAVRRDAEAAAAAERASHLVDELRFGSLRDPEVLLRAAHRFGLALDRPHAGAVFAYDGPNLRAWDTAIRWVEMPVREERGRGWTIVSGDVPAQTRRIRERLEGIVGDGTVLAASGSLVTTPTETARSFREAEITLALLRNRGDERVLSNDQLGVQALLLSVPRERLDRYATAALGPILTRPELVQTLAAWYETGASRAGVAARLGIHRNSVGYRMTRIRERLGADPTDQKTARGLQAALDAREVLAALDRIDTEEWSV